MGRDKVCGTRNRSFRAIPHLCGCWIAAISRTAASFVIYHLALTDDRSRAVLDLRDRDKAVYILGGVIALYAGVIRVVDQICHFRNTDRGGRRGRRDGRHRADASGRERTAAGRRDECVTRGFVFEYRRLFVAKVAVIFVQGRRGYAVAR